MQQKMETITGFQTAANLYATDLSLSRAPRVIKEPYVGPHIGIFDIFKPGVGPSSSHTIGPMLAGYEFQKAVADKVEDISRVVVDLYGSLALTGKGHATDKASIIGLSGEAPATINPDHGDSIFDEAVENKRIRLCDVKYIDFDYDQDVLFHFDIELPEHPNAMAITAFDKDGTSVLTETYFSIGGGFIKTAKELTSTEHVEYPTVPFPFKCFADIMEICNKNKISVAEMMIQNDMALHGLPRQEVLDRIDEIFFVTNKCVDRGLRKDGFLPVTGLPRQAKKIFEDLTLKPEASVADHFIIMDWVSLYARAVNEENACGGKIITAPTNGAAGTLPAVLLYYARFFHRSSSDGIRDFIATAAAVGSVIKMNASISGAEAGCQAEVGSACSMAAAGLCAVLGGNISQIENAAEVALEHNLGMTCDPIAGLVQIPCIERNCVAAVKAIVSTRIAMRNQGMHAVSLDSCIRAMYETGLDLQSAYRETSLAGLAKHASLPQQVFTASHSEEMSPLDKDPAAHRRVSLKERIAALGKTSS